MVMRGFKNTLEMPLTSEPFLALLLSSLVVPWNHNRQLSCGMQQVKQLFDLLNAGVRSCEQLRASWHTKQGGAAVTCLKLLEVRLNGRGLTYSL